MADIYLYIYDISYGLARILSQSIVGQHFEGIWHTGVVVRGIEYFFAQEGICHCIAGTLAIGQPVEKKLMGQTSLSASEFQAYMDHLSDTIFRAGTYNLFYYNCNTFSNHVIKDLTGNTIPSHITDLPANILQTPIGPLLQTFIEGAANVTGPSVAKISHEETMENVNFTAVLEEVKPVLYDEPLYSEYSEESLDTLFSSPRVDLACQWASEARKKLRSLTLPVLPNETCDTDTYSLLQFNRHATLRQCEAICEIFRLAVWRFPEFLIGLFTDPLKNLHSLADAYPPERGKTSRSEYFNLETAKARLLCNCIGLASQDANLLPLDPLVKLCIRLIGFDSSKLDLQFRSAEHEFAGISLSLNLSICPFMQNSEALELAASLFHLINTKGNFKHPTQACYVLRTIYVLMKRFVDVASLAKSFNVGDHVSELLNQAENAVDVDATANSNSGRLDSVEIDRRVAEELTAMLN
ncbi:unnamed protein product [Schistocephalus solidus]|uniref:DUF862 domain-containing protein n=1 Tax=Schistocephalus solidus TaxID=70667 RepID=A0A0X3Q624_SCHSO|nr:unnamed protein product [Schistocephalus solidus]